MAFKSLTFILEISIGTYDEQLQEETGVANEFSEALLESISKFPNEISTASGGRFIGNVKIVEQSTDWQ